MGVDINAVLSRMRRRGATPLAMEVMANELERYNHALKNNRPVYCPECGCRASQTKLLHDVCAYRRIMGRKPKMIVADRRHNPERKRWRYEKSAADTGLSWRTRVLGGDAPPRTRHPRT